jgi:hypothetical protein
MVDEFAAGLEDDREQTLLQLMAGLFDAFDGRRSSMLAGIKRFYQRQQIVAEKAAEAQAKLGDLEAKGVAHDDPQYLDAAHQVAWNARVFDERNKLTLYICDEPVYLEQRLGTLARAIAGHLAGG